MTDQTESAIRRLAELAVEAAIWIETGPEKAESLCRDLRKYAALKGTAPDAPAPLAPAEPVAWVSRRTMERLQRGDHKPQTLTRGTPDEVVCLPLYTAPPTSDRASLIAKVEEERLSENSEWAKGWNACVVHVLAILRSQP